MLRKDFYLRSDHSYAFENAVPKNTQFSRIQWFYLPRDNWIQPAKLERSKFRTFGSDMLQCEGFEDA